jgi:hypothetical protein
MVGQDVLHPAWVSLQTGRKSLFCPTFFCSSPLVDAASFLILHAAPISGCN